MILQALTVIPLFWTGMVREGNWAIISLLYLVFYRVSIIGCAYHIDHMKKKGDAED